MDKTERGRKNRRDAMILVCAAAFACMPLLWRGVYDGHDLLFHLNRIEGIASGLRNGQFPVRIHSSTLLATASRAGILSRIVSLFSGGACAPGRIAERERAGV